MKNEEISKFSTKRIIAHLDMDAFFASIEEADSPIFKGKPIAVGSDPLNGSGRGVVSTANYKAREYGIQSALPISQAWQLSQKAKKEGKDEVVFLPVDFARYTEVSCGIYEIIKKYVVPPRAGSRCGVIEPASIDEFYFDLTHNSSLRGRTPSEARGTDVAIPEVEIASSPLAPRNDGNWQKAEKICKKIKKEIKQKYKITCSVGLGPNKLIAKIAAGQKKPDGFVVVGENSETAKKDIEKFLEPLSVRELPGVGPKTGEILSKKGIEKIKDLKKFSYEDLYDLLGKHGIELYYKAKGIDDSELQENREAKSIGEQTTFEKDTLNAVYIGDIFEKLCSDVFLRFKDSGFKSFKTIGITVRFAGFQTCTTAKTLKENIDSKKIFKLEVLKLLLPYLDSRKNPHKKLIRLIGVNIKNFNN